MRMNPNAPVPTLPFEFLKPSLCFSPGDLVSIPLSHIPSLLRARVGRLAIPKSEMKDRRKELERISQQKTFTASAAQAVLTLLSQQPSSD